MQGRQLKQVQASALIMLMALCQQCGKSIEAAQVQPDNADIQVGTVWTMAVHVVLTAITFKLARHGASGSGVQACKNVCVMVSSVHQLLSTKPCKPVHACMHATERLAEATVH